MSFKKLTAFIVFASIVIFAGCKKDDKDAETPTVVSTSPSDDDMDVALDKIISVTFSEEMDASSINASSFMLKKGTANIAGTVSYSGNTATFKPNENLSGNVLYTTTITKAAKSKAGKALAADVKWSFTTGSNASGMEKVSLGSSGNFVILAKTALTNNPNSAITGDVGISPAAASFITGFSLVAATGYATSTQITGKVYAADMAAPTPTNLTTAIEDMVLAYNDAAGRSNPDFMELATGDIGGKTLVPGLYKWTNTVLAATNLEISGSSTDVWIFQIAGDLAVSADVIMTLSGGAKAENIFWQVAGEVNLGTGSDFKGVLLSMTGITMQSGAVFTGRALAQTAVILDANTVTQP